MGGTSSEREVSLKSGNNIYSALKRKGYNVMKHDFKGHMPELFALNYDIAFNIIHGGEGEDGKLNGFFQLMHKTYVGSDQFVQSVTMAKHFCQPLLKSLNLNIPQYIIVHENNNYKETLKDFMNRFGKIIIKPTTEGSSVGILITGKFEEAMEYMEKEMNIYTTFICEEYIKGTELTVGMINRGDKIKVFTPLEIQAKREFYNYEAKYTKGATEFIIPPRISPNMIEKVKSQGMIIFKELGIKDFARADCILFNGKLFWHDVNTVPGMTELSDLPQMAKYDGIDFDDLVEKILLGALEN